MTDIFLNFLLFECNLFFLLRGFYQCVYDAPPFHNQCDPGLLFRDDVLVCDYAANVECHGRPIPGQVTPDPSEKP